MRLCRVTGDVVSTFKSDKLHGQRLMIVQPVALDARTAEGPSFLAVDRVGAGVGDLVLILQEGGGIRILFGDKQTPITVVILAIVDELEAVDPATLVGSSTLELSQAAGGSQ